MIMDNFWWGYLWVGMRFVEYGVPYSGFHLRSPNKRWPPFETHARKRAILVQHHTPEVVDSKRLNGTKESEVRGPAEVRLLLVLD